MKSLLFLPILLGTSIASAQLRTSSTTSSTSQLRTTRQMMEAQTEMTVLEKLEESRLQDERLRMQRFETLNFNMVAEPRPAQDHQNPGYGS